MKTFLFALIMITAGLARGVDAPADSAATDTLYPPPAPAGNLRYSFGDFMLRDRVAPPQGYLSVSLDISGLQWYAPPTRFQSVMNGAGAAASLGMFVGAIGTTLGWFGEDETWAMVGAMAAAGMLYGNARYEAHPRLGISWDPDR